MTKPEPHDFTAAPAHCHSVKINNCIGPSRYAGNCSDRVKGVSDLGEKKKSNLQANK